MCVSIFNEYDFPLQNLVRTEDTFVHFPITEIDVIRTIKIIKSKKCTIDEVPFYIVINCANIIVAVLTYLFNLSMTTGRFPESFKVGKITQINKSGSRKEVKSY